MLQAFFDAHKRWSVKGWGLAFNYYFQKALGLVYGPGRECPICGWSGRQFEPYFNIDDGVVRGHVLCPRCRSFERHRAYKTFYDNFFSTGKCLKSPRVLHFAPEECLEPTVRRYSGEYIKSNYPKAESGELCLDLRTLKEIPDESFDIFIMNNVLSCMPGDLDAIKSMHRALKKGGWVLAGDALTQGQRTVEKHAPGYGGSHRVYGMLDLNERFKPFNVELIDVTAGLPAEKIQKQGLNRPQYMIVLMKKT